MTLGGDVKPIVTLCMHEKLRDSYAVFLHILVKYAFVSSRRFWFKLRLGGEGELLESNPEVWQISYLEISIRLGAALLLGGLIGLEREIGNHSAGFRTHILVCIGSALITILSAYGFSDFVNEPNVRTDPARLTAQIISGIGFLGAGTILRTGLVVSGLTTAASLWVVAAIGIGVGAGFYYAAGLATLMVLVSLFLLNKLEKVMWKSRKNREMLIRMQDRPGVLGAVATILGANGISIVKYQVESSDKDQTAMVRINIKLAKPAKLQRTVEQLAGMQEIISIEVDQMVTG